MEVSGLVRPAPPLGFGTANIYAGRDREGSLRAIGTALDSGITWFDTARLYGHGEAEKLLGQALRGRRHNVTLVSKAGILPSQVTVGRRVHAKLASLINRVPIARPPARASEPIRPQFGAFGVGQIRASVEQSLRLLNTDYLDALLLHEATEADGLSTDVQALLDDLKREGKIRAAGTATSPAITQKLAQAAFDIQQVASSAWIDNVTSLRATSHAFLVTHSALGKPLADLLERLAADANLRRLAQRQGFDANPADLPRQLLAGAMLRNPHGVVLFSSRQPQRIARAAAANEIAPAEAEAALAFIRATADD